MTSDQPPPDTDAHARSGALLSERAGLSGKIALIIGGAGGLGRAATVDLARAGVRVAVGDRDPRALAGIDQELNGLGADFLTCQVDARETAVLGAFIRSAETRFGGIDVLVNVVGSARRESFVDSTPRHWYAAMETNFTWVLFAVHSALPALRASTRGASVINFTSIEAHRAAPGFAVYGAMKAALQSLTRTLAVELAPEGVRFNTIAADMVVTAGFQRVVANEPDREIWGDGPSGAVSAAISVPAARRGRSEDVGSAVLFLASELSNYITGQTLHPDGGAHASAGWMNWPGVGFRNGPPPEVVARFVADDPQG